MSSSYHKERYYQSSTSERIRNNYGTDRRGYIPKPETVAEKIERLQRGGFISKPAEAINLDNNNLLSGYNLGNKELPAYRHKDEILDKLSKNRIILLTGPTGSGKTTQLGQYALEAGYDRIVYLQPRRINTDNTGDRIEDELRAQLGDAMPKDLVGIAHSERATFTENSQVISMTSATFTKMLPELSTKWSDEKVLIVSDEIHENNLETEFASAFAVRAVEKKAQWRMAFASATPDKKILQGSYQSVNGGPIPVVEIQGRPFDLEMTESANQDVVEAYLSNNAGIEKSMIFVEGKPRIEEVIRDLKKTMSSDELKITRFFKLHADISERAKDEIFKMKLNPGEKAIVVSTSAGQSGITIPGVGLVVGSGITRSPELDGENAEGIPIRHCTQAELVQQAGRAGRDISGGKFILARPVGFRRSKNRDNSLYDFIPLQDRDPDMPPEIYHSNISRNVLTAAAMDEDFRELNRYLKNSVSERTICEAYDVLQKLGAVYDDDDGNEKVSDIGRIMDLYPLRPELSRAVAETIATGADLNVQTYVLMIAAAIEAGGLDDFDNRSDEWKRSLRETTVDDFIAQLDLMMATRDCYYGKSVNETELALRGLSPRRTYRAHRQFGKMCKLIGLNFRDIDLPTPSMDEEDEVRDLLLTGMPDLIYNRSLTIRGQPIYKNIWGYDEAIPREIGSRSLLGSMGAAACKIVVGYPRWYAKEDGTVKNVIDTGFVTTPDRIKRVLGELVCGNLKSEIRGGNLVKSGELSMGSMSFGNSKVTAVAARTEQDARTMVNALMRGDVDYPARQELHKLGMTNDEIRAHAMNMAIGIGSVRQLDAKLWSVVSDFRQELDLGDMAPSLGA